MESISQIYDETQPFTLDKIGDNLNSPTQFELTDLEENKAISNEIPDPRNKEKKNAKIKKTKSSVNKSQIEQPKMVKHKSALDNSGIANMDLKIQRKKSNKDTLTK